MPRKRRQGHNYDPAAINSFDKTYAQVLGPDEREQYDETTVERVYFALDREACQVKIGWSRNVERRIARLSAIRGRPLELLATLDGNRHLEHCFHRQFADYRREPLEWYSTEILGDIAKLVTS